MADNILGQIELLQKVQAIDSQIREFSKTSGEVPSKLTEIEQLRENERAGISEAKKTLLHVEQETSRLEKEIAFDRQTLEKFNERIQTLTDVEAIEAASKELDHRKRVIRSKEENILRLMEEAETTEKKIQQLNEDFIKQAEQLSEQEGQLKEQAGEFEEKTAALREERKSLGDQLPASVLNRFQRIVDQRDGLGIVSVEDEICQGCLMSVPPEIVNDTRTGLKGIQSCANCQRIIYWAE